MQYYASVTDRRLFNYSLTGQVLEDVKDAKYLGVTLSSDLEWSKHIATIINKANSKLSFLRHNLKGCPEKLKQTLLFFDSLFYAIFKILI